MKTELSYSPIRPIATYSPWLQDIEFKKTHEIIRTNTLVGLYRLHELWNLVEQCVRLPGDLIEVGVWRGGTGCLMARRAQLLGSTATVFLCDSFRGVVKTSESDSRYRGGEHADTSVSLVQKLISDLGLSNTEILEGVFPEETGARVADRQFVFCHIDVDVYQSGLDVIEWVWPRMPVGAVVVYDDYGFEGCDGVTRLVNERIGLPGTLTIHNLNGHAVVVKTAEPNR
jgi:O-methyltransferase